MKAELKEVLKLIDRLNPHDLAIVQEKIAPSPKQSTALQDDSAAIPKNDVFTLPFEKYLALADEERKKVQWRAYQVHQPWIDAELDRRAANWLLVCHGKIIESSSSWQDYPSREKLMALGKKFGFVPFVFVREPMIEESMWHSLPGSDFYPTLKITIGAEGSRAENLPLSGLVFIADFDTGSPNLFLNYSITLKNFVILTIILDTIINHFNSLIFLIRANPRHPRYPRSILVAALLL